MRCGPPSTPVRRPAAGACRAGAGFREARAAGEPRIDQRTPTAVESWTAALFSVEDSAAAALRSKAGVSEEGGPKDQRGSSWLRASARGACFAVSPPQ